MRKNNRNFKYKATAVILAMMLAAAVTGCAGSTSSDSGNAGTASESGSSDEASDSSTAGEAAQTSASSDSMTALDMQSAILSQIDTDDMFTERDLRDDSDETDTVAIKLNGSTASCSDSSVDIDGGTITITQAGTYVLSGTLENGTVIVDAGDDDKVELVLSGAEISAESYACIYAKNADKVFVTLAADSTNSLTVSGEYVQQDDNNVDAVIFSKCDLTLKGDGELSVSAETGHGIVSKDDLVCAGGMYDIDTPDHCLNGKDSVRIAGGTYKLVCDEDGIHAGNDEQTDGFVYIEDGDIDISVGDDGIHAEGVVYITGGDIDITKSYEGIEGHKVLVSGGDIDVTSSDDGFNAAGSSSTEGGDSASDDSAAAEPESSDANVAAATQMSSDTGTSTQQLGMGGGFGGGMGGGDGGFGDTDSEAYLVISGGTINVNAGGDGLDSNGYLGVTGGELYVLGPSDNGNGALDYGLSAAISGGTVIAVGGSGMAETFGDQSSQCSALVSFDEWVDAGETITLTNSDGDILLSWQADKTYNSVVISCADMTDGGEYTLTAGDESSTFTMDGVTYGSASGGMSQPGGDMNMPGGNSDSQDSNNQPNGDMGQPNAGDTQSDDSTGQPSGDNQPGGNGQFGGAPNQPNGNMTQPGGTMPGNNQNDGSQESDTQSGDTQPDGTQSDYTGDSVTEA